MNKQLQKRLGALAILATPALSFAAIDVTAITAAGADVALVGAAVFAVFVGVKVFKWIRGTL